MAHTVVTFVPWTVVPIILLALFVFSLTIVSRLREPESKASARAGVWAGLVLFVTFVLSQLRELREPQFTFAAVPDLDTAPLIIGVVVGFIFLWTVRLLLRTPVVGVTTLLLCAGSTSALYSFLFIESLRPTMLYLALGVAFGVLFHIVLFPSSMRKLWEPPS